MPRSKRRARLSQFMQNAHRGNAAAALRLAAHACNARFAHVAGVRAAKPARHPWLAALCSAFVVARGGRSGTHRASCRAPVFVKRLKLRAVEVSALIASVAARPKLASMKGSLRSDGIASGAVITSRTARRTTSRLRSRRRAARGRRCALLGQKPPSNAQRHLGKSRAAAKRRSATTKRSAARGRAVDQSPKSIPSLVALLAAANDFEANNNAGACAARQRVHSSKPSKDAAKTKTRLLVRW